MKCILCGGDVVEKKGPYIFNSERLGKVTVPFVTFDECTICFKRYVSLEQSKVITDYWKSLLPGEEK